MFYQEPYGALIQDDVSVAYYYLSTGVEPNWIIENMGQRLCDIAASNCWRAKDAQLLLRAILDRSVFDIKNTAA